MAYEADVEAIYNTTVADAAVDINQSQIVSDHYEIAVNLVTELYAAGMLEII